jgi:hypothetical protein
MKLLNLGTYAVIIVVFIVLVITAFGTTDPTELKRWLELIAIRLMGML